MPAQPKTGINKVVNALQRQQANALVAYLNYKKYHWLTFGPLFRDLHLLFEEHATLILASLDELAERALMIDGLPLADPAAYLPSATIQPSAGPKGVAEMVKAAVAMHETIIDEMHGDAEIAAKAGDIGTTDLLTRLVQVHEKQRWFLLQLLRKGDGLGR